MMNPLVRQALDRVNLYVQAIDWDAVASDKSEDVLVRKDIAKAIHSVEFLKSALNLLSRSS